MSKVGDIFKKVEEGIADFFTGDKEDKATDTMASEPEEASYSVDTENLAVPEIHTGKVDQSGKPEEPEETITYDTLAMPEIHIKRK